MMSSKPNLKLGMSHKFITDLKKSDIFLVFHAPTFFCALIKKEVGGLSGRIPPFIEIT